MRVIGAGAEVRMEAVEAFTRLFSFNRIVTDSPIFRVHYRVMTLLLMCFGLVSTYDLYYGRPISCFAARSDQFPDGVLDNVCWTTGRLTFPARNGSSSSPGADEKPVKVGYYKWVGFFLFHQCLMFYLPHYTWLFFENNRMKQLVGKLKAKDKKEQLAEELQQQQQQQYDSAARLLPAARRFSSCAAAAADEREGGKTDGVQAPAVTQTGRFLERYFHADRRRALRHYAVEYLACEALNLVCVVASLAVTNAFLGGELHNVGMETFGGAEAGDESSRSSVFPRVVRCVFDGIDEGGSLSPRQAICVLSESTMNEFIFAVLWVANVLLLFADLLTVVYRGVFLRSVATRNFVLTRYCSCAKNEYVAAVTRHCDVSEFLVIFLLSDNLGPSHFLRVLKEMAKIKMRTNERRHDVASLISGSDDDDEEESIPMSPPDSPSARNRSNDKTV